jgi:tetratricopeptide (TPR) repeat protein
MLRYGSLCILAILFMTACASNPEAVPEGDGGLSLQDETEAINDGRTAIAVGSPDSLRRVLVEIGSSDIRQSEVGRDLLFAASRMFSMLYPLLEPPDVTVLPPPSSSLYVRLFDQIVAGTYPQVPPDQVSFLTLILPPLTILYSEEPQVDEQAVQALDQAATLNPDSVLPFLLHGMIAERNDRLEDAFVLFDTALKVAPSCYPARHGLARVLYKTGQYEDAFRTTSLLKNTFPDNVTFLTLNTRILFALGRFTDAEKENQDALRLDAGDTSLLLLRVQILEKLGSNDPFARRLLSIVEESMPDNIDVLRMKARFLEKEGNSEAAIEVLERAIELHPGDDEFESRYGRLLIETGRSVEGKEVIENRLEDDPDSVDSLEILLAQAEKSEDWAEAGDYIQRVLELDASPAYLRKAVRIYSALERYVTAVGYAAMLAEDPEVSADDLEVHADILIVLERYERARSVLNDARERADTGRQRSSIWFTLSTIAEDEEERKAALQQSLFEDSLNFDTLVSLSAFFEERGDYRKARQFLSQAATLRPEDRTIGAHLAELQEKADE